jgi:hypothetical protein
VLVGLDDVAICRDGNDAVVEPGSVRLHLGARGHALSEQDIVDRYNAWILDRAGHAAPSPRHAWDEAAGRWRPLLRVTDDDDRFVIDIPRLPP